MTKLWLAAIMGLAVTAGSALAQPSAGFSGSHFGTFRGAGVVTGHIGSIATTTLPDSARSGLLMQNGNGTSTLLVPGAPPQTVITPR